MEVDDKTNQKLQKASSPPLSKVSRKAEQDDEGRLSNEKLSGCLSASGKAPGASSPTGPNPRFSLVPPEYGLYNRTQMPGRTAGNECDNWYCTIYMDRSVLFVSD